jgi:5-methylcytosine-specific restriction endonuclease McrA
MDIATESKGSTWEDLTHRLEDGTGKRLEQQYRRGYWDGIYQVLEFLKEGTPARQLDHWLHNKVWEWRYGDCDEIIMPPQVLAWPKLRKFVLESYGEICAYCGERATHVDHVIPVSQGGGDEIENLVAACQGCNSHKHARTPEEAGMKIKFYPLRELEIIEKGYYRELTIRFKS